MSNIKRYNGSSWVSQPIDADTLGGKAPSSFQDKLVSGTNIKTINGSSILGSGNVTISASVPIKTLKTDNTAAQTPSANESIAGSGTINLHKVAKTGSYNDLNDKPTTLSGYGITDAVPAVNDIGRINNTVIGIVSVSCGDDNMLFLGTDSSTSDYAYLKGKNEVVIMAHNSDESTTSYGGITIYPGSRPNALIDGIEQPMAIKADLPTAISTSDLNAILV